MFTKANRVSMFCGIVCVLTLLPALQGKSSASNAPSGSYSCLGTSTFGTVVEANKSSTISTESQLMHISLPPLSPPGSLTVSFFGEVCRFKLTALAIAVGPTGEGTMSFSFNPNVTDVDKDPGYNCGTVLFGTSTSTTSITETYNITTSNGGARFYFIGADNFINFTNDNGDFFTPSGVCDRQ